MKPNIQLSVIVPAWDEENNIKRTLEDIVSYLKKTKVLL